MSRAGANKRKKLLFFVTEDWYFCSHRLELAVAAQEAGYDVAVVTRERQHGEMIREAGIRLIPIEMSRGGTRFRGEVRSFREVHRIYRRERPDLVSHIAIKPILYGTAAARLAGTQGIVNTFTGLGLLFSSDHARARAFRPVLRLLLRGLLHSRRVMAIFQNPDDASVLQKAIMPGQSALIPGSGVDTSRFVASPEPPETPVVVLASRLLWQKGLREFVEAARLLRREGTQARFAVVGKTDPENANTIPTEQMSRWQEEGAIEWWGFRDDMPAVYANSHIACLPSYYGEGVPKALIEAASCGRAIVTTDVPGCREVVADGENGFLVPARDSVALAAALRRLIVDPDLRSRMGQVGRQRAVSEFAIDRVISATLDVYRQSLSK